MSKLDKEDIAKAIEMWNKGSSSSVIAAALGVSRNVVIGHINRQRAKGVHVIHKPTFVPKKKKESAKIRLPTDKPKSLHLVKAARTKMLEPSSKGLRIWELGLNQCKYPVHTTEHDHHYFCGAHTDSVYCEVHAKICYNRDVSKPKPKIKINIDTKRKFLHYR